ncbi:hypothetical protein F5Y19DRAFT_468841 [Xylariaceae sp. FL1651]|nr:hypothetical protein F5Y19DRAFT_468841 [Xylariaceae sp. FL1651]
MSESTSSTTRHTSNIRKACEQCRKAKLRCDGDNPCRRCLAKNRQAECVYRLRPRTRKQTRRVQSQPGSKNASPAHQRNGDVSRGTESSSARPEPDSNEGAHNFYHRSVTATYEHESDCIYTSRLFYGPSSAFAFSQQVYRMLWRLTEQDQHNSINLSSDSDTVQEGGPGLSLFKQRTIFFGTPTRVDSRLAAHSIAWPVLRERLPLSEATQLLPFFSSSEIISLLHAMYNGKVGASMPPQMQAVIFIILANGALNTPHTDLAESLFCRAKQEAAICDDEVSLTMIQISLLLATYQDSMGRPHSSYLHTGVATRKVFAMGLSNYGAGGDARLDIIQKRRAMIWSVYYHETMHALFLGRESTLKRASIQSPYPDHQPALVGLCKLAQIAEDSAAAIYSLPSASLWQLYQAAEKIHSRLQACAEELGIASAAAPRSALFTQTTVLQLHNVYYHILLLTFRPFLIAEFALHSGVPRSPSKHMWLRRACRIATEAAQDSIVFMNEACRDSDFCKSVRFNAFFLESSCMVLLYDTLRNPSKLSYNQEYTRMALECADRMVKDEPVVHAQLSMRETSRIVEPKSIKPKAPGDRGGFEPTNLTSESSHRQYSQATPEATHDFLVDESRHMIYLNGTVPAVSVYSAENMAGGAIPDASFNYQNHNLLTTDLFNFFSLDMLDPCSLWQM